MHKGRVSACCHCSEYVNIKRWQAYGDALSCRLEAGKLPASMGRKHEAEQEASAAVIADRTRQTK